VLIVRFPISPRLFLAFGTQPAGKAHDKRAPGFRRVSKRTAPCGQRVTGRTTRRWIATLPNRPGIPRAKATVIQ
jgi:hypothetical protein